MGAGNLYTKDTDSVERMSQDSLADNLGYQLHLAARRVDAHDRALLARLGLTPARYTALIYVRERPGIDQSELGRLLLVNRSAGMKVAARLAQQGLLDRAEGRDKRSVGLILTPEGEAVVAEAAIRLRASPPPVGSPFSTLTECQRAKLLQLLGKVNSAPVHIDNQEKTDD